MKNFYIRGKEVYNMRLENGRHRLLHVEILLFMAILLISTEVSASQNEYWLLEIVGIGQNLPLATNESSVFIGMAQSAETVSYPAYAPNYTVDMRLAGNLFKDARQFGSANETWYLILEIGTYADHDAAGYYPQLLWNPNDIAAGSTLELRRGDNGNGQLLVENMGITNTYLTQEADGEYFSLLDKSFLQYTIIFVPSAPTTDIESLNLNYGRNLLTDLHPAATSYSSYDFLSDLKESGYHCSFHHLHFEPQNHLDTQDLFRGPFSSTYWFFGKVSGKNINLPINTSAQEDKDLIIIDRFH